MMYTFDKANANVASNHHTQYFEMMGDHAIYHDGWIASTKVMRAPWSLTGAVNQNPGGFPYELYDLTKDWTQYDNVAAKYPDKLKELEQLFWTEANKYQVLPLDASTLTRLNLVRPGPRASFTKRVQTATAAHLSNEYLSPGRGSSCSRISGSRSER